MRTMQRTGLFLASMVVVHLCSHIRSAAQAGYQPGDVIVGAWDTKSQQYSMILGITPQGRLYTLVAQMPFLVYSIIPAEDNRAVLAAGSTFTGQGSRALALIRADGTVRYRLPGHIGLSVTGLDVDGGGNLIVTNWAKHTGDFSVLKLAGIHATTLYDAKQIPNAMGSGLDPGSGDLIIGSQHPTQYSTCTLLRAGCTGSISASTLTTLTGIVPWSFTIWLRHDPDTDTMWLTRSYSRIDRLALSSPATVTKLHAGAPLGTRAGLPDRDPRDGRLVIPTFDNSPPAAPPRVLRFDPVNKSYQLVSTLSGVVPLAATVAGTRHLCGLTEAVRGLPYTMLVSSPGEPGAVYAVAMSFGIHPGIPAGSRKIHLNPDPLFHFSLAGGNIFSGFQGVLDSRGEGLAAVLIPRHPNLSGVRLFAAAITMVNHRISVISTPLGVTIQ